MPGVAAPRIIGRKLYLLQATKSAIINTCIQGAPLDKLFQLPELWDTDGRLDIAEVVLESVGEHVIVPIAVFSVTVPCVVAGAM